MHAPAAIPLLFVRPGYGWLFKANPNHDAKGRFASGSFRGSRAQQARALLGDPVARVAIGTIQAREGEKASDAAFRWLAENPQDNLHRSGLGRVVFDRKSVSDTLNHGFSGPKLNALSAVPDVVRHGVQLDSDMDWNGRPLLNHILAAPIELGGHRYTMFVRLRKDTAASNAPTRFYVHEAVLEEYITNKEARPLFKFGSDPDEYRGRKSGGTGFYVSLARRVLGVKDGDDIRKAIRISPLPRPIKPKPIPLLFVIRGARP